MNGKIEAKEHFSCDIEIDDTGSFIGLVKFRSYDAGRLTGLTEDSIRSQFDQLLQLSASGAMVRDGVVLTGYHNKDTKGDVLLLDGEFIGTWYSDDFEWCHFMELGKDVETCSAPSPWLLQDAITMWLRESPMITTRAPTNS